MIMTVYEFIKRFGEDYCFLFAKRKGKKYEFIDYSPSSVWAILNYDDEDVPHRKEKESALEKTFFMYLAKKNIICFED